MASRIRLQGKSFHADTKDLHEILHFDTFADVSRCQSFCLKVVNGTPVTLTPSDYGISNITDIYIVPDQQVTVTISSTDFTLDDLLIFRGVALTGDIVITNGLSTAAEVKVVIGGD